jgi:hypothetical protein
MTHGLVLDFPPPIEFYDAVHAEIGRRATGGVDGMLLHVSRPTNGGCQVIEIWESKEKCDRFFAEVVWPAVDSVSRDQAPPAKPTMEEFEPRGLIIPSAAVAF